MLKLKDLFGQGLVDVRLAFLHFGLRSAVAQALAWFRFFLGSRARLVPIILGETTLNWLIPALVFLQIPLA